MGCSYDEEQRPPGASQVKPTKPQADQARTTDSEPSRWPRSGPAAVADDVPNADRPETNTRPDCPTPRLEPSSPSHRAGPERPHPDPTPTRTVRSTHGESRPHVPLRNPKRPTHVTALLAPGPPTLSQVEAISAVFVTENPRRFVEREARAVLPKPGPTRSITGNMRSSRADICAPLYAAIRAPCGASASA